MNNKANAIEIMNFGKPERITLGLPSHFAGYLGVNHEGFDGGGHHLPVGSWWTDIWGTGWHKEFPDVMGFPKKCPLAEVKNLKTYKWPDPNDERIVKKIFEDAKNWNPEETFLMGSHRDTLWEKTYMLVGMENAMMYFYDEPGFMREVLRRIMDFQVAMQKHYLSAGVEIVLTSDDLGTQIAPLLSPELVREFLLPEYKRLMSVYREKGVYITHHSCGNIVQMIDIFLEMGINILNPVQASANNLYELREKTMGRIALDGGISSGLIVTGPIERIRQEVKEKMRLLGKNGGYFCNADQGMPWPKEHYAALRDAVEEFGKYPLGN